MSSLKELQKIPYEEFAGDHILHRAAERDFQIAIQACLDIASLLVAEKSPELPETYAEIFPKLAKIGLIPVELAQRMSYMAKFRNVLVHLYLEVDLELVYRYLQNNLDDFERFTQYVGEYL